MNCGKLLIEKDACMRCPACVLEAKTIIQDLKIKPFYKMSRPEMSMFNAAYLTLNLAIGLKGLQDFVKYGERATP